MSFSYGAAPPPLPSPPLPATGLSPAPPPLSLSERRARRQRIRTSPSSTTDESSLSSGSPVSLKRSMTALATAFDTMNATGKEYDARTTIDNLGLAVNPAYEGMVRARGIPARSHQSLVAPKLISPLPPHALKRHPSPSPSFSSSDNNTVESQLSSYSSGLSFSTSSSTSTSLRNPYGRRKTITIHNIHQLPTHVDGGGSSGSSQSSLSAANTLSTATTPTTPATFSAAGAAGRSRGRSISRVVAPKLKKVASMATEYFSMINIKSGSNSKTANGGTVPVEEVASYGRCEVAGGIGGVPEVPKLTSKH